MRRDFQYLVVLGAMGIAGLLALLGFAHTGGAVPWGERFATVMQGGVEAGSGPLLQTGRGGVGGFLLAGPLRDEVGPFLLLVLVLVAASVGLYWWSSRPDSP
ncbi:MAG: cobalamin transport operon protein [Halodesulfurarchaeum sp.]